MFFTYYEHKVVLPCIHGKHEKLEPKKFIHGRRHLKSCDWYSFPHWLLKRGHSMSEYLQEWLHSKQVSIISWVSRYIEAITLVITALCALHIVDFNAVKYKCVLCLIQLEIPGNMSCRSRSVKVNSSGLTTRHVSANLHGRPSSLCGVRYMRCKKKG